MIRLFDIGNEVIVLSLINVPPQKVINKDVLLQTETDFFESK